MALLQCKILPTWAKALSSPIASFSTPNDKAECAKINKLYLGDALSVGLQILQASEPNMALWVCQIVITWAKALSYSLISDPDPSSSAF